MFVCTRERFLEELLFPKQATKNKQSLFLSARGYFRIKPLLHKLFMSMVCPSLGHPTPHTVLLILSLSRAQPSKGFISKNYLIATPPFLKVQQLQGCPQLSRGDAQENHRASVPFLVTGSQGMRTEQGKTCPRCRG